MWQDFYSFVRAESIELLEWAKCGEGAVSVVPTGLWALGAVAVAHRILASLFTRFLFRRVPLWELMLQNLLFIWMVIYSLHFWVMLVRLLKYLIEYCYDEDGNLPLSVEVTNAKRLMQQWVVWMFSAVPLAVYLHTRPRPDPPPIMIWITTTPWQRREMGPYGYYLHRPLLASMQSSADQRAHQALRKATSDSKVIIKEPPKKRRSSKSV